MKDANLELAIKNETNGMTSGSLNKHFEGIIEEDNEYNSSVTDKSAKEEREGEIIRKNE